MSLTPLLVDALSENLPTRFYLYTTKAGQVAPNEAGYVLTPTAQENLFQGNIAEACDDVYRIVVVDTDGTPVGSGYCYLTDTANNHYCAGSYFLATLQEQVISALNGSTWTDEELNSFNLTVIK